MPQGFHAFESRTGWTLLEPPWVDQRAAVRAPLVTYFDSLEASSSVQPTAFTQTPPSPALEEILFNRHHVEVGPTFNDFDGGGVALKLSFANE
jgi:hypothetical protein